MNDRKRHFLCGIVQGKKEFFRASLYVWYLQYWALCDDLVVFITFQTVSRGQVLNFFYRQYHNESYEREAANYGPIL